MTPQSGSKSKVVIIIILLLNPVVFALQRKKGDNCSRQKRRTVISSYFPHCRVEVTVLGWASRDGVGAFRARVPRN